MTRAIVLPLALLLATPALADLEVQFREGAPKDRFTLTNTSDCTLSAVRVTIDLSGSAAGLIFDVSENGAGVEVFQPFDLVSGREFLSTLPVVEDGQTDIVLDLVSLGPNQDVSFTIDVDDTAGAREITVSGAEITGAQVRVDGARANAEAVFNDAAVARVSIADCFS